MQAACLAWALMQPSRQGRQLQSPAAQQGAQVAGPGRGKSPVGLRGLVRVGAFLSGASTSRWGMTEERQVWVGHKPGAIKPPAPFLLSLPLACQVGDRENDGPALGPRYPIWKRAMVEAEASIKWGCRLLKSKSRVCFVFFLHTFFKDTIQITYNSPFRLYHSVVFSVLRKLSYHHQSNFRIFSSAQKETLLRLRSTSW